MRWWLLCVQYLLAKGGELYGLSSTTPAFRDCLLVAIDPVSGKQTPTGSAILNCSVAGIQQAQPGEGDVVYWFGYDLDFSHNNSCRLFSSRLSTGEVLAEIKMPFYEQEGFFGFSEMLVYNSNTREVVAFGTLPGHQSTGVRSIIAMNPTTGQWRNLTSLTIVADAGQASTFDPSTNQALFQVGMERSLVVKVVDVLTGTMSNLELWDIVTMNYHSGDNRIYCASYQGEAWGVASFSIKARDWKYVGKITPGGWLGIDNQYSALDVDKGILYVMFYNVSGAPTMYIVGIDVVTAKEVSVTPTSSYPVPQALVVG